MERGIFPLYIRVLLRDIGLFSMEAGVYPFEGGVFPMGIRVFRSGKSVFFAKKIANSIKIRDNTDSKIGCSLRNQSISITRLAGMLKSIVINFL